MSDCFGVNSKYSIHTYYDNNVVQRGTYVYTNLATYYYIHSIVFYRDLGFLDTPDN
jgi:hypothetical protein